MVNMFIRRAIVGVLLTVLLAPPLGAAQLQQRRVRWTQPPNTEIRSLLRQATAHATHLETSRITLYFSLDSTIEPPAHVLASMQALIDLVETKGTLTVDLLEYPLDIIVLPYEDFVHYSKLVGQNIQRARPDWSFVVAPERTNANFLPIPSYDRNVVLTHTWEWFTILHELCHIAIMRQWSADAAANHTIVFALQNTILRTDDYLAFLAYATRR